VVFDKDQFWVCCCSSYRYITDLPLGINTDSKPLVYADDTSVLLNGNRLNDLQIKSATVLKSMSKWFTLNGLSLI